MAILVNEHTKVVVQGITGREAATFTRDTLDYGTPVVGGVTPGKGGRDVHGVPVYDTMARCVREHPAANVSVVSVPPLMVRDAALEALDAGLPLVVIATERVPRRDTAEIREVAAERGATVIGPNSLGVLSPHVAKAGMVGGRAEDVRKAYGPGRVGVVSRSGGMTTELANALTAAGIGQSTCVSVGGDALVCSTFVDLVPLFADDPDTDAVVLFCEPGGAAEEVLCDWLEDVGPDLPVVAFVAGRFADTMPGVRFGHAGTVVEGTKGSTAAKIERFEQVGVRVAPVVSEVAPLVRQALER